MKLELLDVSKFIKVNKCPEVTNSTMLDSPTMPSEDGLLSYELFGMPGTGKRTSIFGYIDLKEPFFSPAIFKALMGKHRLMDRIISGHVTVGVGKDGEIVEDPNETMDNSGTGIGWLIRYIRDIRFARNDSNKRNVDLDLIEKATDEKLFITKLPIIPASYRDMNKQDSTGGTRMVIHEITSKYNSCLTNVKMLERFQGDIEQGNLTRLRIQNSLLDLYLYFLKVLGSKHGFIKSHVLKKTVDYGTLSVITTMPFNAKKPTDLKVPFGYMGVPINQIVTHFTPFFEVGIRQFMMEEIRNIRQIEAALEIQYDLDDNAEGLVQDHAYVENIIKKFVDSPDNRFDPIIPPQNGENKIALKIQEDDTWRDMTLMDMMYLLAIDIIEGKHITFTRYPVENFQSKAIAKIKIVTTLKTKTVTIRNRVYDEYPEIRDYPDPTKVLIEVTMINPAYCPAMGADFDGDTVFIEALYTEEANAECDKLVRGKAMLLDPKGSNSRGIAAEGLAAIYALTSHGPNSEKPK
jgi:DNA-directed RNA polymerase beta' subunit